MATTHNKTLPGLIIYANNTDIYADSQDYYVDGSIVMRDVSHASTTHTKEASSSVTMTKVSYP